MSGTNVGGFVVDFETLRERVQAAHPSSQRALGALLSCVELHAEKSADYGSSEDPFIDFALVGWMTGLESWQCAAVRVLEKATRLGNAVRKTLKDPHIPPFRNEGMVDTARDLALLSGITLALYDRDQEERALNAALPGVTGRIALHRLLALRSLLEMNEPDDPRGESERAHDLLSEIAAIVEGLEETNGRPSVTVGV